MTSPMDVPGRSPVDSSFTMSGSPSHSVMGSFVSFSLFSHPSLGDRRNEDLPVDLVPGEKLEESAEFHLCQVFLTNYRLIVLYEKNRASGSPLVESIAIVNIDTVDSIGCDQLRLSCKDARVIRLCASSTEQALLWYKKLTTLALARPPSSIFSFAISKAVKNGPETPEWCKTPARPEYEFDEKAFFKRMNLDPDCFEVCDYNRDYSICSSYPRQLIIPKGMDQKEIEALRDYRMLGRIPAVVWHCTKKNTLLLRASQPRCSLFSWRSPQDEKFLRQVNEYTNEKRGQKNSAQIKIYDCRSYTAALGNRMKGGGTENIENYSNMTLEWCNLPNIHTVRYCFVSLRSLFNPPVDQASFLSSLQASNWLSHIMTLLSFANKAAEQLVDKGVNVLIHCSDGWDRTTQLVTLVKVLVDPYYRTMEGMEELIRRDWIGYGHKFSDRNGISGTDQNERCPIFLQWLDAVHQIYMKYQYEFKFTMAYLVKLASHASSGLFTSFCFNTVQEMETACSSETLEPFPIWRMLADEQYENVLYDPNPEGKEQTRLVAPDNMQAMRLWNEVYRCHEVESLLTTKHEEERNAERGTQTPVAGERDHGCKESSNGGMERSMVKSRSSESIASTSESQILAAITPAHPHRLSESVESDAETRERRGTRSSISNGDGVVVRERGGDVSGGTFSNPSSAPSSPDVKKVLDHDGLVRYVDQMQESARRRLRQKYYQEPMDRRRMRSERSDTSLRDDEPFQIDDIMSDASLVDEHEVMNTPRNHGMVMHATHCHLCRNPFSRVKLNLKQNCDSCGRAVCTSCSSHTFMDTVDGAAKQRKACNECYSKMYSSPLSSPPSSLSTTPSPPGTRSCPPDGESSRAPPGYVSPSQAVKG